MSDLPSLPEMTSHLCPQLLGRMTQRAVVEALKQTGPMSRADIARVTGISATTVSSAITQVLRAGFVEETDATITGPGRPGKILRLAIGTAQVIGVSVEPEWCEMIVGGLDAQPLANKQIRFPTPNTYARLLAEIERHARSWMTPDSRTLGVGLSLPGLIDPTGETAVYSPNFHQTDDQRPSHDLANRLELPTVLLQESDTLCLGERRVQRTDDLAVIDYSGGLGVGVLSNGRLLGRHLALPRELGHLTVVPGGELCGCGNRGCLETVSTDAALARMISQKVGRSLTVDEACELVRDEPNEFRPQFEMVLDFLAIAVAATVNLFAPPKIVLHGRFLEWLPDSLARLHTLALPRILRPLRPRCVLVAGETTKAVGALAGILDHLFEELGPQIDTFMKPRE